MTINNFIALLKNIAAAHLQIHSFAEGELSEIGEKKDGDKLLYPHLFAVIGDADIHGKLLRQEVTLYLVDLLLADKSNAAEIKSDLQLIALDIIAQLKADAYADDFIIDDELSMSPVSGLSADDASGWKISLKVQLPYMADRCAVPSSLVPSVISPQCAEAVALNTAGEEIVSIPSGASATIPDATAIVQIAGSPVTLDTIRPGETKAVVTRVYQWPAPEGCPAYATGDSRWFDDNVLAGLDRSGYLAGLAAGSRTELAGNNYHGNTLVVTDASGNATTPGFNKYFEHHLLGLGLYTGLNTSNWADALSACLNLSVTVNGNTYDDFVLAPISVLESLKNFSLNNNLGDYLEVDRVWSSTISPNSSGTAALIIVDTRTSPYGIGNANGYFIASRILN